MPERKTAIINVSKGLLGVSLTTLAAVGGATGNIWLAGAAAVPAAVLSVGLLGPLLDKKKEESLELPMPPWWGHGEKEWLAVCSGIEDHLSPIVEGSITRLQEANEMPTAKNLRQAFAAEVLQQLPSKVARQDQQLLANYLTPLLLDKSAQVLQNALKSLQEATLVRMLSQVATLLDDAHTLPSLSPVAVSVQAVDGIIASVPDAEVELERKWKAAAYDIYISYDEADTIEVMKIGDQLKAHGILPWFDVIDADPGKLARPQQEEQIGRIPTAAVFIGQQAIGRGQVLQTYSFIEQFVQRGCSVIPVILPGTQGKPKLPIYLANFAGVDFRLQNPDPFKRLILGIKGKR